MGKLFNVDVVLMVQGHENATIFYTNSRNKYCAMIKDTFGERVSVSDITTAKITNTDIISTAPGLKSEIEDVSFQAHTTLGFPDSKTFNKFKLTHPEYFGNTVDGRLTVYLKAPDHE